MEILRVDELGHAAHERRGQVLVPRRRARLDHRLAFPRRRLGPVVREGGVERAGEHAGPPTGAEREVDAERDALGGRVGQVGDHVRGRGLGAVTAHLLAMEQQEVDVARVVQLPAPELAEGHHRVPLRADHREARVGDIADLRHHLLEGRAAEVAGRDPEHRPAAEPPEAGAGAVRRDVTVELGPQGLTIARGDVRQRLDLLGMTDQQVARGRREPEQPRRDREDLGARQELARSGVVTHPREGDARQLRIGRLREGPAEDLGREHGGIVGRGSRLGVGLVLADAVPDSGTQFQDVEQGLRTRGPESAPAIRRSRRLRSPPAIADR